MKKILIVYTKMVIGGSTTSLLSLLRTIDLNKYEVDLLLFKHGGELEHLIPSGVRILPAASKEKSKKKKIFSFSWAISKIKYRYYKNKGRYAYNQIMAYTNARKNSIGLDYTYDIAIGYLEFWPNAYVAERVKAEKKIAWIHVDYLGTKLNPDLDIKCFSKFDYLITVSEDCKKSLTTAFPVLRDRIMVIHNILIKDYVNDRSAEKTTIMLVGSKMILISVSRLSNEAKALDRAITVTSRLVKEGYEFDWYIVGGGPDEKALKELVQKEKCEKYIHFLGETNNPYALVKQADLFFLPSKYEGKPMSVTEAQMLNIPAFVTNYASAHSQVENNVEGLIVENNEIAIYEGLKYLFQNPSKIDEYKYNLSKVDKSNYDEIFKLYSLFEA